MRLKSSRILALLATLPALSGVAVAAQSQEERNLNELRNTVVNLLQTLVERGVVSREQAEAMVKSAQEKAATDAAATAAQDAAEANAVRVPYVPEIVKEEIRKQVTKDLAPEVAKQVVEQGQAEGWASSAMLPDWLHRVRWSGDVRVRGQSDLFASDNAENAYVDFQTVNSKGGIGKAGLDAFANTTEDRYRLRVRARMGLDAELGRGWSVGTRLVTGNLTDPVSTNQTLGNTGERYQTGFDLAFANWSGTSSDQRHTLSLIGGRIPNPWQTNDLVWDPDLTFEGIASTYRMGFTRDARSSHFAFLTVGAFPIQEVELSKDDKWLYGAQTGLDWRFDNGGRARFGVAYYYYDHIVGQRNALNSNLLDYTAPQFLQVGNTLFDIRNDDIATDPNNASNLFALATNYHLIDATFGLDWQLTSTYKLAVTGEYVKNVGYDRLQVLQNTGHDLKPQDVGYLGELSFGHSVMARPGAWRVAFGYRYLEADSTLDAFADSDFHLGGTNAKGYIISADVSFTERVFGRLRYLSANEITGQIVGIDVLQLDVNAQF
ncbi:MAG: putative porin [Gammaproteobacteria bacterium]